jgi:hypothetical protein
MFMKEGSKMTLESRQKLSLSLKGHIPWNKGKKFSTRTETSATILRRDKNYYLKELKANAIRSVSKNGYLDEKRINQIKQLADKRQKLTGVGRKRKKWTLEELSYLHKNYRFMDILEMALDLNRSWSSVEHKLNRLKLTNYNNWTRGEVKLNGRRTNINNARGILSSN